jgi:hypothetical protein
MLLRSILLNQKHSNFKGPNSRGQMYHDLLAFIGDLLVGFAGYVPTNAVTVSNHDNAECAFFAHPREGALAFANG